MYKIQNVLKHTKYMVVIALMFRGNGVRDSGTTPFSMDVFCNLPPKLRWIEERKRVTGREKKREGGTKEREKGREGKNDSKVLKQNLCGESLTIPYMITGHLNQ